MASVSPAHVHSDRLQLHAKDQCPWCEQAIPDDRADEIHARIEMREMEQERRLRADYEAKANAEKEALRQTMTRDFAAREATARQEGVKAGESAMAEKIAIAERDKVAMADKVTVVEREKREVQMQLKVANESAASREIAARQDGIKAGETAMTGKVTAAEREKNEMKARLDEANATSTAREAAARQEGARATEKAMAEKVAVSEREKAEVAKRAVQLEGERNEAKQALDAANANHVADLAFARTAYEQAKDEELNRERAKSHEKTAKLEEQLQTTLRQLAEKTAQDLGEGAEVILYDELKAEFPDDRITRIEKGVAGADVRHEVMYNNKVCGTILYDSKNRSAWRNEYVTKLKDDQIADKADHAVLVTRVFPSGEKHVALQDGVALVHPTRVLPIVHLIRRHIVQSHTLRLSTEAKAQKKDKLYAFFTSQRSAEIFERMSGINDKLQDLEVSEQKAHSKMWKDRGVLLKGAERLHGELINEIEQIIGTGFDAEDV